ncbi:hypothetical protein AXG93_4031s1460 [Marchantia polymorpha subsp. ruderalis]|nr:hypothetical protein AXG93_4031s1460 [Marchantia polymorpha subsp. ruderalis]
MDPLSAISDEDSSDEESDSEEEDGGRSGSGGDEKHEDDGASLKTGSKLVKKPELDFEALSRHGYSGGPSIMHVPAPKNEAGDQDWTWSNGKRKSEDKAEEGIEDRELTREIVSDSAPKMAAQALAEANFLKKQKRDAAAEQRALSFSQKEKRKRDLGQATRAKNYVEEEKRLLRDQGVYSGFDT